MSSNQISVRGETYQAIKDRAKAEGIPASHLVERLIREALVALEPRDSRRRG